MRYYETRESGYGDIETTYNDLVAGSVSLKGSKE